MLTLFRRQQAATPPPPRTARVAVVPAAHRQTFTVEVAYFSTVCEIADCLASPVSGRRVVLFGGKGPLPAPLQNHLNDVVRADAGDPFAAAVTPAANTTRPHTPPAPRSRVGPTSESFVPCP
jgi:hypothetical protein